VKLIALGRTRARLSGRTFIGETGREGVKGKGKRGEEKGVGNLNASAKFCVR